MLSTVDRRLPRSAREETEIRRGEGWIAEGLARERCPRGHRNRGIGNVETGPLLQSGPRRLAGTGGYAKVLRQFRVVERRDRPTDAWVVRSRGLDVDPPNTPLY